MDAIARIMHGDEQTQDWWQPLTPAGVARLFAGATFPWWIAGGYAIEVAAGRPLRWHGDIDVLLLRRDHLAARHLLRAWDCWVADPPGTLHPWPPGESLPAIAHDVWCRHHRGAPWRLQLMLDEADGDQRVSRRDPSLSLTRSLATLGWRDARGIPYLAPEIQLLYKAKAPRPRDEQDLAAALPILTPAQRQWLHDAIVRSLGPDHPWLATLIGGDPLPAPPPSGA